MYVYMYDGIYCYNNILLTISLLCSTLLVLGKVPCGMAVVS